MGYAAVKGGLDAIRAAENLVRRRRDGGTSARLRVDQVVERLRLAVDRVQGEGGLWAPDLAARAIRQAEGDVIEASLLVRSYRSTLPRVAYSLPMSVRDLVVIRRIVPAFRQPPAPSCSAGPSTTPSDWSTSPRIRRRRRRTVIDRSAEREPVDLKAVRSARPGRSGPSGSSTCSGHGTSSSSAG